MYSGAVEAPAVHAAVARCRSQCSASWLQSQPSVSRSWSLLHCSTHQKQPQAKRCQPVKTPSIWLTYM